MSFKLASKSQIALLTLIILTVVGSALSQSSPLVTETAKSPMTVAAGSNLYSAGFIQTRAIPTENKIVGGYDEADKYNYAQNDFLFINVGTGKGVSVGDVFTVVRPRGTVKSTWSRKGDLGFYVQEVGALEVIDVKSAYSVARVRFSCDTMLLGDLIHLSERRSSPLNEKLKPLDRFADPTGKARGRVIMARDGQEMITRDQIAYIDLGTDEGARVGDRVTIFRDVEKGNIFTMPQRDIVTSRDYGYESDEYKGGKFSNQSSRKSGEKADGKEMTTERAKNGRPYLRKVVGEAVILNVKEKTATVVITRTGQEIHTGDYVEIQ